MCTSDHWGEDSSGARVYRGWSAELFGSRVRLKQGVLLEEKGMSVASKELRDVIQKRDEQVQERAERMQQQVSSILILPKENIPMLWAGMS